MNTTKIFKKTTWLAVCLSVLLVALTGCRNDNLPFELQDAKQPITIVLSNEAGVIVSDGDGRIYAYKESYYFANMIMKSDLKKGDVITGN
ncbi:MAG: hypothetical protein COA94_04915 [Rickettsiales bacterium]|nr:MAG: hypothetical protein COA94_04915 [Rickettsiales bacterium]